MRRSKSYENMSKEELKANASFPHFMKDFMKINLTENPVINTRIIQNGIQTNTCAGGEMSIMYILNAKVVGILIMSQTREILVVAVLPDYRNRGIAKDLIGKAIQYGATKFIGSISPTLVNHVWAFYHERWRFI